MAVSRLKPLWQAIWNLPVLSKVKNLVWKATKNSLPTKDNLVRRKIIQNGSYDVCREHMEDVKHALYSCPKLAELWKKMPQWTHVNVSSVGNYGPDWKCLRTKQGASNVCHSSVGLVDSKKQLKNG